MTQAIRKKQEVSKFRTTEVINNATSRKSLLDTSLKDFGFQLLAGKVYPATKHEKTLSWQKRESKELELFKLSLAAVLIVNNFNAVKFNRQLESLAIQSSEDFTIHIISKTETEQKLTQCLESSDITCKITLHFTSNLDIISTYKKINEIVTEKNLFLLQENAILHPQAIFILLKELKKNKELSLCYFNEVFISLGSKSEFYLRKVFQESKFSFIQRNWLGDSYLINKQVLNKILEREEFSFRKSIMQGQLNYMVANSICCGNFTRSFVPLGLSYSEKSRSQILASENLKETPVFPSVDKQSLQIVIPFKNQSKLTIKCLESILKQECLGNTEITLVSNNSTSCEFEKIKSFISSSKSNRNLKIKLIEYSNHFNFARINNFGASKSNSDYILFLNNDVELVSLSAVRKMKSLASLEDVGIVGGSLYYPNGNLQHAGINFAAIRPLNVRDENMFSDLLREVDGVSFAMALMKRDVWLSMEGLDEIHCPNGFGDALFCQKLINSNRKCIICPEAKAYHYESISRGESIEDLELFEMTSSGLRIASEFQSLEAKRQPELISLNSSGTEGEFFDKLVWQIKNRKKLLFVCNKFAEFLVFLKKSINSREK